MYTLVHIITHHKKMGIIHTLATRAVIISDNKHLEDELGDLSKSLQNNGYIKKDIRRKLKMEKYIRNKNTKKNTKQEDGAKVLLPYIQGTTNKISKVLRKSRINTIFFPPTSLRNILDREKGLIDPKLRKGIYSIPCSCGEVYIGETRRSIKLRLK